MRPLGALGSSTSSASRASPPRTTKTKYRQKIIMRLRFQWEARARPPLSQAQALRLTCAAPVRRVRCHLVPICRLEARLASRRSRLRPPPGPCQACPRGKKKQKMEGGKGGAGLMKLMQNYSHHHHGPLALELCCAPRRVRSELTCRTVMRVFRHGARSLTSAVATATSSLSCRIPLERCALWRKTTCSAWTRCFALANAVAHTSRLGTSTAELHSGRVAQQEINNQTTKASASLIPMMTCCRSLF